MQMQKILKKIIRMDNEKKIILFLKNEKINPSHNNNEALIISSENGYLNSVTALFKYESVLSASNIELSFALAAQNGHIDIIKLFIKSLQLDPSLHFNWAIYNAHKNNHTHIINYLWKDQRIKKTIIKNHLNIYNEIIKKEIIKF